MHPMLFPFVHFLHMLHIGSVHESGRSVHDLARSNMDRPNWTIVGFHFFNLDENHAADFW